MTERCAFCGDDRVIHRHHVIPRRYGGSDADENLLPLCPTCHAIVEDTWDDEFYDAIGAVKDDVDREEEAILNACRVINLAFDLDELSDVEQPITDLTVRSAVAEARTTCLEAVLDLRDDYWLCQGCERPADRDPCPNCGTVNEGLEVLA